jgi:hypothetical protein
LAFNLHRMRGMTRTWTTLAIGIVAAAAIACGSGDRAPDRDATQGATGTTGRAAGEITVSGCLAPGQMGTYMLTPDGTDGPATTGYQLLGEPDDFNQYMNRRVRVVGTRNEDARGRPDSDVAGRVDDKRGETPWPQLQVREVDPIGGECASRP